MKTEMTKEHSKAYKKKQVRTWLVRIFAILLVVFMLIGTFYYALIPFFM